MLIEDSTFVKDSREEYIIYLYYYYLISLLETPKGSICIYIIFLRLDLITTLVSILPLTVTEYYPRRNTIVSLLYYFIILTELL
jgi:hypothetical protein